MARDEAVEQAAERLTAIYSKCLTLSQECFPETVNDKTSQRITILALMKDMVGLIASGMLPPRGKPIAEAPIPPEKPAPFIKPELKPEPEPIPQERVGEEATSWRPHKSGGGEWTYSSDLPRLKEELAAGRGRYSDQDYNYTLSDDGRFISRWRRAK